MNRVLLSGKVIEVLNVGDEMGMILIEEPHVPNKRYFYAYYDKELFTNLDVKTYRKTVFVAGELEHIRVKTDERSVSKKLTAIRIDEIEVLSNDF